MIFIKAYRESVSKRGTFFYAVKIERRPYYNNVLSLFFKTAYYSSGKGQ